MVDRRTFLQGAGALVAPMLWSVGASADDAPNPPPDLVPAPPRGLQGNSNYFISSAGNPIRGLVVTIEVTEDIIAPNGMGLQLNAYSPSGSNSNWQQYTTAFGGKKVPTFEMISGVENWPTKDYAQTLLTKDGVPLGNNIFNYHGPAFGKFATPRDRMPAGTKLRFELLYDDKDPRALLVGATYTLQGRGGTVMSSGPERISSFKFAKTKKAVTNDALAPIVTLQMNLVGMTNGEYAFIQSGAGTITYEAADPLSALVEAPADTESPGTTTLEHSNIVYGQLDSQPNRKLVQTFRASMTPRYTPGGMFAVTRRFGADATLFFAISIEGRPAAFVAEKDGPWTETAGYGPTDLAFPRGGVAACASAGDDKKTALFVHDQTGTMQVIWLDDTGAPTGPETFGPKNLTGQGSPLAASKRFGGNSSEVFVVDSNGQLTVFSQRGKGAWSEARSIGATRVFDHKETELTVTRGVKAGGTDLFAVNAGGDLLVFHAEGAGDWTGPDKIGDAGFARPGANVAVVSRGDDKGSEGFLFGKGGQLHRFSNDGSGPWSALMPVGAKGAAVSGAPLAASRDIEPGQTHLFYVDTNGGLNFVAIGDDGTAATPVTIGPSGLAPTDSRAAKGVHVAVSQRFDAPGQTDVFFIGADGRPMVASKRGGSDWVGPAVMGSL